MTINPPAPRVCVVTPYYKEDRALLDRCLASVRRQAPAVDHMVIADGFPQAWLDTAPVRHIKLDRPHGDYGNAARGAGALLAIAEGYDAIAFLDADNWYDDDHIASCLAEVEAAGERDLAYVIAQRRFCRPDASTINGTPSDAPFSEHVDTNCFLFLPGAFEVLHRWCTIPNQLSAWGDQIFGKILRSAGLPSVTVPRRTVNYLCVTESIYRLLGETPPPGSKPTVRWADAQAWIYAQPPAGRRHVERMTGLTIEQVAAAPTPMASDAPAALAAPDHLTVEIPGSPHPAQLRRSEADIADYKRIFIAQVYASAGLPSDAGLIVDLAAGIGLSALYLQVRYPGATVVAAEARHENFELLAQNMVGCGGGRVVHARVTPLPARLDLDGAGPLQASAAPDADGPVVSLCDLVETAGDLPIDLLRLAPEQWRDMMAAGPASLRHIRTVLIDAPSGPQCIDVSALTSPDIGALPAPALADPHLPLVAA